MAVQRGLGAAAHSGQGDQLGPTAQKRGGTAERRERES